MRHRNNKLKKLVILIPCFNECDGIGNVIDMIPLTQLEHNRFSTEIIVIDNNSSDSTADVALSKGATVIHEGKQGKGNALRTGFNSLGKDVDLVVMLDGDATYDAGEITRLIEPIENRFCDVVIGSRLNGKMHHDAMRTLNRIGNWFFTIIVRSHYKINVTDVLTGFFAWDKRVLDELSPHLKSEGFAIEMEMITKMAKLNHVIYSVPISYTPRHGSTNLRPFYDGRRILKMFVTTLRWKPSQTFTDEA